MSLKVKKADPKRAALPLESEITKEFRKDWARHQKTGRANLSKAKDAMALLIANEGSLPPEWKDHQLQGAWADYRELHVGGDFLLVYTSAKEKITFARLGSHSELFK